MEHARDDQCIQYGERFAAYYDALIEGDYSYQRYAGYVENIFDKYGVQKGALVADLGCGTGTLCVELAFRGYEVIGVDRSPHMLSVARDKSIKSGVPDILFLEQEIDSIVLNTRAAAFVSTIDCVNYITDKKRLRRLFRNVGRFLRPGGLFIFDISSEFNLSTIIGNKFYYKIDDDVCYLWKNRYNKRSKISESDITFFLRERGDIWQRVDEIHRQRAYTPADIDEAARGSGMELAGMYSFLGFRRPDRSAKKINFIYTKNVDRCG